MAVSVRQAGNKTDEQLVDGGVGGVSQKTRILDVRVSSPVYIGQTTVQPDNDDPAVDTWTDDAARVMEWLCAGYRYRFNQLRAWRSRGVYAKNPGTGKVEPVCYPDTGERVLVALGRDPVHQTQAEARAGHSFLAALPDLILQTPAKLEPTEWFAAAKRRATLSGKGQWSGRMPGMKRRDMFAQFVCWFNGGRNAVYRRTSKRTGVVTITGMNPAGKRTLPDRNTSVRWRVEVVVRHTQTIRPYTSVRVNWLTKQVVFTNEPAPIERAPTGAVAGVDVGVVHTITTSDGQFFDQPDTADVDRKIRHAQRKVSRSRRINNPANVKGWTPTKGYTQRRAELHALHRQRTARLDDWRHKTTTALVRDYDLLAVEDLRVVSMMRSAKGTVANPGTNVRQKAGLNRSLASSAFATLRAMLTYKAAAAGITLVAVDPRNTSRQCPTCHHTSPENRKSQAVFACTRCGHSGNADTIGATNILGRAKQANWGGQSQAGSHTRTEPSKEVQPYGAGGSGDEPRTTQTAQAA